MKFSLINVGSTSNGRVSGAWIQNHVGTLDSALARARDVEAANSHRITVAVVSEVPSPRPDLSYWYDRDQLA